MAEIKPEDIQEPLETEENGVSFDLQKAKVDMSFVLKMEHGLPKITTDYILAQFVRIARNEGEGKSLQAVLENLVDFICEKRGNLSPAHTAIKAYAKKLGASVRASISDAETTAPAGPVVKTVSDKPAPEPSAPIAVVTDAVQVSASAALSKIEEAVAPQEPSRVPDVMGLGIEGAIKKIFPTMRELLVQTLRMRLIRGPGEEETGDPLWFQKHIEELVGRFPDIQKDLDAHNISARTAASLLFGEAVQEANRAAVARSERRGPLQTLVGDEIRSEDIRARLEMERAIAGARGKRSGSSSFPPPADVAPATLASGATGASGAELQPAVPATATPTDEQKPLNDSTSGVDTAAADTGTPAGTDAPAITFSEEEEDEIHSRPTVNPEEMAQRATISNEAALTQAVEDSRRTGTNPQADIVTTPIDSAAVRAHVTGLQRAEAGKSDPPKGSTGGLVARVKKIFGKE
ncbi:MAG: hypothetical protein U0519_02750 [Candidatus Gracilibacteria bacterium]